MEQHQKAARRSIDKNPVVRKLTDIDILRVLHFIFSHSKAQGTLFE
jgi:hypothetical protein